MTDFLRLEDIAGTVDFAIITVRDDEFMAVLDRLPGRVPVYGGVQPYQFATVAAEGGRKRRVAAVKLLEQGPATAQAVTTHAISELQPSWVILAGIAGGKPHDEFTLGDVLLASRLHDFLVFAAEDGGVRTYQQRGGPVHRRAGYILQHLVAFKDSLGPWNGEDALGRLAPAIEVSAESIYGPPSHRERTRRSLERHFPGGGPRRPPRFAVHPGATGSALVKDPELLRSWEESARHITHVEMEAGGAYEATQRADVPLLCIRGISDIVGFKRSDDWTGYACQTAASFLMALIRSDAIREEAEPSPLIRNGAPAHRIGARPVGRPAPEGRPRESRESTRPPATPPDALLPFYLVIGFAILLAAGYTTADFDHTLRILDGVQAVVVLLIAAVVGVRARRSAPAPDAQGIRQDAVRYWVALWIIWPLMYVWYFAASFLRPEVRDSVGNVVANAFNNLQSLAFIALAVCISRRMPPRQLLQRSCGSLAIVPVLALIEYLPASRPWSIFMGIINGLAAGAALGWFTSELLRRLGGLFLLAMIPYGLVQVGFPVLRGFGPEARTWVLGPVLMVGIKLYALGAKIVLFSSIHGLLKRDGALAAYAADAAAAAEPVEEQGRAVS